MATPVVSCDRPGITSAGRRDASSGRHTMADVLRSGKVGILVGGGPAPGINGVIAAATIEAVKNGAEVVGIYEGFRWLATGRLDDRHFRRLGIDDVSRMHWIGASILRTSRFTADKSRRASTH